MKINYNVSAMIANNALKTNDNALTNSLERLSSGLKINHAKDNASGLAMAKRMNAQIKSLDVANQNSNDGISVIEIAEGALSEIEEMVQRMNELAVKACNGTIEDAEREFIDEEIVQLKAEIERISKATMYNGQKLLDGTFDVKGYTDNLNVKVSTYTDEVRSGEYVFDSITAVFNNGELDPAACSVSFGANFPAAAKYTFEGASLIVEASDNFRMEYTLKGDLTGQRVTVNVTGLGDMKMQIGTNEGQELDVRIAKSSLKTLGIDKVDCRTKEKSEAFLDKMSGALNYINSARSRLGAYQNRLEHTVNTLDISEENMTAAYSRIMDVDMAEEMTEYTKNNVLVQAGTGMLAQANERPSSVLQLLQ